VEGTEKRRSERGASGERVWATRERDGRRRSEKEREVPEEEGGEEGETRITVFTDGNVTGTDGRERKRERERNSAR